MKKNKLDSLFRSARITSPPVPSADFESAVLRAIRGEPRTARAHPSLFEQLGSLFPRLALASAALICLCVVIDYRAGGSGSPELDDGMAQVSDELTLPAGGF